jgi:lysophospholipase L1-like esterase
VRRGIRNLLLWAAALVIVALVGVGWFELRAMAADLSAIPEQAGASAIVPLGILGDSDSHSYQDSVSFPPGTRFGAYRAVTFQWPEVLARMLPQRFDLGAWGTRGAHRPRVAELMDRIGLGGRFPRKEDYLYNLAYSGARCESLTGINGRQAPRLVAQMDRDPDRWRKGVVVIYIGGNDFGHADSLDLLAADPMAAPVQARISACLEQFRAAIGIIRKTHPQTRIVLVGMVGDVNDASSQGRWRSATAQRNISAGFDVFDHALAAMAEADPNVAFLDIRGWFARHWGGRDEHGEPNYKAVVIGGFAVSNTAGDDPKNALIADEHAGVVWNALWAQELVSVVNAKFGAGIAPITDAEIADFIRPAIAASH